MSDRGDKPPADQPGTEGPRCQTGMSGIWAFLNSEFGRLIISSVLIAGAAKIYSDWRADTAIAVQRRSELALAITELQLRDARLDRDSDALAQLEIIQKSKPTAFERKHPLLGVNWPNWSKKSPIQIQKEVLTDVRDVLQGGNSYTPSSPAFTGQDMGGIITRIDILFGDGFPSRHHVELRERLLRSDDQSFGPDGAIEAIQWLETSPAANPDGVSDKELLGTWSIHEVLDYDGVRSAQFIKCEVPLGDPPKLGSWGHQRKLRHCEAALVGPPGWRRAPPPAGRP